jgi:REP element-mobilizing transposase RayT
MRTSVTTAIREHCSYREWNLGEMSVRTEHVHLVVSAPAAPERVMNALKSHATRRLHNEGLLPNDIKAWSRHGSTKYLWDERAVEDASTYVLYGQGDPLSS